MLLVLRMHESEKRVEMFSPLKSQYCWDSHPAGWVRCRQLRQFSNCASKILQAAVKSPIALEGWDDVCAFTLTVVK